MIRHMDAQAICDSKTYFKTFPFFEMGKSFFITQFVLPVREASKAFNDKGEVVLFVFLHIILRAFYVESKTTLLHACATAVAIFFLKWYTLDGVENVDA